MTILHHTKLKAAVKKYRELLTEGKTIDEVRAAIITDGHEESHVEEILIALERPNENKAHLVKVSFRDINDFSIEYQPGEDVSHFDKKRLEILVQNNMVEAK